MAVENGVLLGLCAILYGLDSISGKINSDILLRLWNKKYILGEYIITWFQFFKLFVVLTVATYLNSEASSFNSGFLPLVTITNTTIFIMLILSYLGVIGNVFTLTKEKMVGINGQK